MNQSKDREIVAGVKRGDPGTLNDLLSRITTHAEIYGRRLHFDSDTISDIAQTSFIKVWEKIETYKAEEASIYGWVNITVKNTARDFNRRRSRRPEVKLDPEIINTGTYTMKGGEETCEATLYIIQKLPKRQRQVITLRGMHGFSYQEIADCLSIPIGTVRSSLNTARNTIEDKLIKMKILSCRKYINR